MIKVIVIDDDKKMHAKLKEIIRSITISSDNDIELKSFLGYNSLLESEIKDVTERKIYIIDIELANNQSGIQIAKQIRKNDWESEIIFMTNHDKMFETVYRSVYKVFNFIEKFHDFETRMKSDIVKIINMNFDNKMFTYHGRNVDLQVYYKEILYIYRETEDRKLIIVTNKNKFSISMGVQEILTQLDSRFKLVHRACIANINRVQKFNWSEKYFILDNGERVDLLSKKYKKEVEN